MKCECGPATVNRDEICEGHCSERLEWEGAESRAICKPGHLPIEHSGQSSRKRQRPVIGFSKKTGCGSQFYFFLWNWDFLFKDIDTAGGIGHINYTGIDFKCVRFY